MTHCAHCGVEMVWLLEWLIWECPQCQRRMLDDEMRPERDML